MTDVTPLITSDRMVIQAYGVNGFKISGLAFQTPVIVCPEQTIEWDGADMDALLALRDRCDLVLLGTGKTTRILPKDMRQLFKDHGLKIETMDTGAAARAYNSLMADGRRVVAALEIPE